MTSLCKTPRMLDVRGSFPSSTRREDHDGATSEFEELRDCCLHYNRTPTPFEILRSLRSLRSGFLDLSSALEADLSRETLRSDPW